VVIKSFHNRHQFETNCGRQASDDEALRRTHWTERADPDQAMTKISQGARREALFSGSWWGVLIVVAMIPALIWRLFDEEKFHARNLPGYVEYQSKVRYRLIPLVW
jgi:protein-S-isoprenylcysteine O-methyltransferase Ste14